MFDEISIKCPQCNKYFIEQSKAGECTLRGYSLHNLPIAIAQDLLVNDIYCPNCGTKISFISKMNIELIPHIESGDK